MDVRQFVIDYIEGCIEPGVFEKNLLSEPEIMDWLESIVPEGKTIRDAVTKPWEQWWEETPAELRCKLIEKKRELMSLREASFEGRMPATMEMIGLLKDSLEYIRELDATTELMLNLYSDSSSPEEYRKNIPDWVIEMLETPQFCIREVPYDVRKALVPERRKPGTLAYSLNMHDAVSNLVQEAYPEIKLKKDETLGEKYDFMLDVLPSFIGGVEAEESGIFERLIAQVPEDLPKAKRKKLVKEMIKEAFHVSGIGSKHPKWMQEPEWPMKDGHPMRFVRTKKVVKGELFHHIFVDDETGEERIVEDGT